MGKFRFVSLGALASMASIAVASSAHANVVLGSIWENDPTGAGNATIANIPGTAPNVTFSITDPIGLHSPPGAYTIGGFLGSGGGTILTGAGDAGNTMLNTFFEFTGTVTVTNGQTFTAGHDDGLTLVIGSNTVINVPGPTSFVNTTVTYSGPSGDLPFTLVYGECCGAPADLAISLPLTSAIPEPSTWAMMVAGFVGLGFAAFRRSRKGEISVVSA